MLAIIIYHCITALNYHLLKVLSRKYRDIFELESISSIMIYCKMAAADVELSSQDHNLCKSRQDKDRKCFSWDHYFNRLSSSLTVS